MTINLEPFDPTDPVNRIADQLRKDVARLAHEALGGPECDGLPPEDCMIAIVGGIVTGLLGVCFALVENESRGAVVETIIDYMPHATAQAEGILDSVRPIKRADA